MVNLPKIMLAPLAGVTDMTFRRIAFEHGAQGATTEMVSIKGLLYEDKRTKDYLARHPEERHLSLQLFGHEPDVFRQVLEEKREVIQSFQALDLNMGCPAPKIVKNGDGSALMRNPKLAEEVIQTMVAHSPIPVTVKMRLGWNKEEENYLEIGKRAEDKGVSALTLHGRTRDMFYHGQANWEAITRLAEEVNIPVYGNGDIFTGKDALEKMDETRIYGIVIGRGALGNPWLFEEINKLLEKKSYTPPNLKEIYETIHIHYQRVLEDKGEKIGLLQMRKHAAWYLKGLSGNGKVRAKINLAKDIQEIETLLQTYLLGEEN